MKILFGYTRPSWNMLNEFYLSQGLDVNGEVSAKLQRHFERLTNLFTRVNVLVTKILHCNTVARIKVVSHSALTKD